MNTRSITLRKNGHGGFDLPQPRSKAELKEFRQRQDEARTVQANLVTVHDVADHYRTRDNGTGDLNPEPGLVVLSTRRGDQTEEVCFRFDPTSGSAQSMQVLTRSKTSGGTEQTAQSASFEGGLSYSRVSGHEGQEGQRTLLSETADGVVTYQTEPVMVPMKAQETLSGPIALLRDEAGAFRPLQEPPTTLGEIPGWLAAEDAAQQANDLMTDLDDITSRYGVLTFDNEEDLDLCPERGRILFSDSVFSDGDNAGDVEAEIVLGEKGSLPAFVDYSMYNEGIDYGIENCHVLFQNQNGTRKSLAITERSNYNGDFETRRELNEQESGIFYFQQTES